MKIIELILDEDEMETGIEAISIVESPAIESDFVALKDQEIKLAEVDAEKRILMGALLIPNKPIYRNGDEGEYYIYFSKDTVCKASQMFLQNGNQSNSTLEHDKPLNGLTLVESWIVESEQDKSRHYGLNVPVGTWMGAVKVNNSKIWEQYVKTKKVKGFSIEGYFADKMEQTKKVDKEDMEKDMELEAKALLNKIENIVRGEVELSAQKVELNMVKEIEASVSKIKSKYESGVKKTFAAEKEINSSIDLLEETIKMSDNALKTADELESLAKKIGADLNSSTKKAIQDAYGFKSAAEQNVKDLKKAKSTIN